MCQQGAGVTASVGSDERAYSDDAVAAIHSQILRICLAAGLGTDSEDVTQDVWEWLLRRGSPVLALTGPWLSAVVYNYVLRYRRRAARQRGREGVAIETIPEPGKDPDTSGLEAAEVLDRVASALPARERNLLGLVREGYTLARAAQILGIPRGSRAYYGARLVTLAKDRMRPRP